MLCSLYNLPVPLCPVRTMPCSLTIIVVIIASLLTAVNGLGSTSTVAITTNTTVVCGILARETAQVIQCYQNGSVVPVLPNVSFNSISGGQNFFCGLRYGGFSMHCWETRPPSLISGSFPPKRLYQNYTVPLSDVSVGDDHVCAIEVKSGAAKCWRGREDVDGSSLFPSPPEDLQFSKITSGSGFTCGILRSNGSVFCWGGNEIGFEIQRQFSNLTMISLVAGESHACGLDRTRNLQCRGNNSSGQLNVPPNSSFRFSGLALGANFSCAIRDQNGTVSCWGETMNNFPAVRDVSFESIVAGSDFICGLTTWNLTVMCWGSGWTEEVRINSNLPLGMIIPGPCVPDSCNNCGIYPNSDDLCEGNRIICNKCYTELPVALPLPPPSRTPPPVPVPPPNEAGNRLRLVFIIVGSVGGFIGICAVVFCFWVGLLNYCFCFRDNQVPSNSTQTTLVDTTTITATTITTTATTPTTNDSTSMLPPLRSPSDSRRHSSRRLLRQRSGSSFQLVEKAEFFSLPELVAATNNFSLENKIGSGSFGTVYKGKLLDGREVAIKRGETNTKLKKFQEKETAFDSELALLTRLHHKHLVSLVGFCEENDERLLVYEYMSNGALHDHLHKNTSNSGILNNWKMRIKIALDAARGIDYLHNYAVPPIIHRDIKSSNILLDANWIARVSDFGLSLMGPGSNQEIMPMKAVGTVGYIDPEYYLMNALNAKSDVYSFGVVLLELLTGKRALFKNEGDGTGPMRVVEYAMPLISARQLGKVLDKRVEPPQMTEVEAVEILATTALLCVNLEGKERPNITDIVSNLESALALCEDGYTGRVSTSNFSVFTD